MDTTVQDFLAESRFNKSADLSDIDGQQTFHVTYADFGYRNEPNPDEEHVLLFSGPMMASRFILVSKHEIAKSYGIRIIAIDRPGFGGTEAVEIGKRIDITRGKSFPSTSRLSS